MKSNAKSHSVTAAPPSEATARRIVAAATRLFAELGYDGASTKQICAAANANIAAIHYHFGSKEKLYLDILSRFASTRLENTRRTLQKPRNVDDLRVRLELFLTETFTSFVEQHEIMAMVQREVESGRSRGAESFIKSMVEHADVLVLFFNQAQKSGFLAVELDSRLAALGLFGQIVHQMKAPSQIRKAIGIAVHDEKYRARWVQHALWLFLNGALKR